MVSKIILSAILLVIIAAIALAYWTLPAPRPQNAAPMITAPAANASQNSTVSAVNSSSLGAFNGTAGNSSLIPNETLNGSVSQDQNYSVLSTGNIIAFP